MSVAHRLALLHIGGLEGCIDSVMLLRLGRHLPFMSLLRLRTLRFVRRAQLLLGRRDRLSNFLLELLRHRAELPLMQPQLVLVFDRDRYQVTGVLLPYCVHLGTMLQDLVRHRRRVLA